MAPPSSQKGGMDVDQESDLKTQQKAMRRAKKEAREEAEAGVLIRAGTGQRGAKARALANTIWLGTKRRSTEDEVDGSASNSKRQKQQGQNPPEGGKQKGSSQGASKGKATEHSHGQVLRKGTLTLYHHQLPSLTPNYPLAFVLPPLTSIATCQGHESQQPPAKRIASKATQNTKNQRSASSVESEDDSEDTSTDHESDPNQGAEGQDDEDEEDDDDDDDEEDFRQLSDSEVRRVMSKEATTIIQPRSSSPESPVHSTQKHRLIPRQRSVSPGAPPHSRPPTSESEALGPTDTSFEQDPLDSDVDEAPVRISQATSTKPKGSKSKRPRISQADVKDKTAKRRGPAREKSQPTSAKQEPQSGDEVLDDEEGQLWPQHAQLRGSGILDQCMHIRLTAREAIRIVETTLVTDDAWPELHRAADYRVEVLVQAAKTLSKDDRLYRDIKDRVKKDEQFAKILGKWVTDRLPHARGPARADALDHIAIFQLGVGRSCEARVKALFADDTYVYPGHWEEGTPGNPTWVVKGKEMYLNLGLINVMRSAFFATPTAFGFKYKEFYVSSHPDRPQRELTIPLVALAATGIHAALDAWKGGNYIKKASDKFDGDTYKTIFQRHVRYLEGFKAKSLNAYHSVMAELYVKVVGRGDTEDTHQAQGNALAVLDLSGFD